MNATHIFYTPDRTHEIFYARPTSRGIVVKTITRRKDGAELYRQKLGKKIVESEILALRKAGFPENAGVR